MRNDERWRTWEDTPEYGEIFQKRAMGELDEMQSAIATSKLLGPMLNEEDSVLDVGCGSGHYLTSFRKRIDKRFAYTGVDATPYYIKLAQETFADSPDTAFQVGDIFNLPFEDNAFDVVNCSNVLLHLPQIEKPVSELCRVGRRQVLLRTLVGDRSFIVKEVKPPQEGATEFDAQCEPVAYSYFNIYSRDYVSALLQGLPGVAGFEIAEDLDFDQGKINEDRATDSISSERTRCNGGMQRLGYLLLPWAFIKIDLEAGHGGK